MKERKPNRLPGYDYSADNLCFVTSCIQGRDCCFGEIKNIHDVGTGRGSVFVGTGRTCHYPK